MTKQEYQDLKDRLARMEEKTGKKRSQEEKEDLKICKDLLQKWEEDQKSLGMKDIAWAHVVNSAPPIISIPMIFHDWLTGGSRSRQAIKLFGSSTSDSKKK